MTRLPEDWYKFLESWSNELHSKLDRVSFLIGDAHRPSEGSYREQMLRQLLRRVLPDRFRVSTGFIYGWDAPPSRQLDIIIWDATRSGALLEEDEFVIVTEDAVEAIIEVKTTLDRAELRDALDLLHPIRFMSWRFADRPTHIQGLSQQVPEVPIRTIVGFRNDLPTVRKTPATACFEEVANFYRGLYGADAEKMLVQGRGGLRWINLIDAICVSDCLQIEQASLTLEARKASLPGLVAYDFGSHTKRSQMAIGCHCLFLAHLLNNRISPLESAPGKVQEFDLPPAEPAICVFGGNGDSGPIKTRGRRFEDSKSIWIADPPLW